MEVFISAATADNKLTVYTWKTDGGFLLQLLEHKLKAYAKGKASKGFTGWPYSTLPSTDTVVVKNVQSQVNLVRQTYQPEMRRQETCAPSSFSEAGAFSSESRRLSGNILTQGKYNK